MRITCRFTNKSETSPFLAAQRAVFSSSFSMFIVLGIYNFGWNASKQTKFELVHKYEMQMVSDASNTVSKYSCLGKKKFCFNKYETFSRRLSRLFEKNLALKVQVNEINCFHKQSNFTTWQLKVQIN